MITTNAGTSRKEVIVIPMAKPELGEMEHGYLNTCIIQNEIGVGRFIKKFEDEWADFNGYKYGVSCNSGTNALYLAVKASGAKRILIPNFTMVGTAFAAMYPGCEITYYPTRKDLPLAEWDVRVEGYDAIVFAHIYGRKAYPDKAIRYLKQKNPNLIIIDDMAEAHGIVPRGDIACYSFYGNKIVTTGEGGMCLTNSAILAKEMRSLANMYFDEERSMIHPKVGHNFRMTNMQAAVGLGQIERITKILEKREKIQKWYDEFLPEEMKLPQRDVLWFYDIKVKDAEKMRVLLLKQGVESRRFFYPMSLQPWGNQMPDENALWWYEHGLLLPVYNDLDKSSIQWICETLEKVSHKIEF